MRLPGACSALAPSSGRHPATFRILHTSLPDQTKVAHESIGSSRLSFRAPPPIPGHRPWNDLRRPGAPPPRPPAGGSPHPDPRPSRSGGARCLGSPRLGGAPRPSPRGDRFLVGTLASRRGWGAGPGAESIGSGCALLAPTPPGSLLRLSPSARAQKVETPSEPRVFHSIASRVQKGSPYATRIFEP